MTNGHCNDGWVAPNVAVNSARLCLDVCRRRENADYFSWDSNYKTCSCYDGNSCVGTGSTENFKSYQIL